MIKKLIKKYINKETILYVVFGVGTTLVNYLVYYPLRLLGAHYVVANVIAWVLAVAFAYITNKLWVFESKDFRRETIVREVLLFAGARLVSLGAETAFLFVTVSLLGANDYIMKLVASVFVIIINYVFSKLVIFKK